MYSSSHFRKFWYVLFALVFSCTLPISESDMPIGPPITPGVYVNVTPDPTAPRYSNVQAPTATMPVTASDIQALTQVVANVSRSSVNETDGGQITGNVGFFGNVDFEGASIIRHDNPCDERFDNTPVFANGVRINGAGTLQCDRGANFTAGVDIAGGTHFHDNCIASGNINMSGTGRIVYRPILYLQGTVDHINHVDQADVFIIFGLTATRNFQFTNATVGATEVPVIKVRVQGNSGFNAVIKNNAGVTIATLQDDGGVGHMVGCELWHDSGSNDWILGLWTLNP